MTADIQILIDRISKGEKVSQSDTLPTGYRNELMRLMVVFVDSELAGAAGFASQINSAPGVKESILASSIVSEKFSSADRILNLLKGFGVDPQLYVASHAWSARVARSVDLGQRRIGGDKRLNVFHYPLQGWVDSLVMNLMMGTASLTQLRELQNCSYQPLADEMAQILKTESAHTEAGEEGLNQAISNAFSTDEAQNSVNYWYPRVRAAFGRATSDRADLYRKLGLMRSSNVDRLAAWEGEINDRLTRLGLTVPELD
ncbi:1,2-phenylacetyl-CoA epoxidase, catalytic subunit [Oceanospirillum multiglobuliferum]|uniref:Phenylacetic acid catabolic n=1 Tax=Oceanospirillum multiglobuliferum TaxID=64969 RepID=A0A1T4PCT8_9GAMM|nr:Phenylacetic acid catabolic protein [Oceanospirillum multiglobuliferum]OPX55599.1 phenylacetic acid catabolic [Oceanospirillum multiglobuliferum]SJZ89395.1 1,2-phenylacetyl-CoA epoxidase, catalytic subunit [Oceanospirillum multiglobuliferum]